MRKFFKSFNVTEWLIWGISAVAAIVSFFVFKNPNYHYLVGALIGFTALILISKGNPVGLALCVVFAVFYGIISYSYAYYGEMITYLGMSAPIAIASLISWVRNPYKGNKSEVKINTLSKKDWCLFAFLVAAVTCAFFFILRALNTANIIVSTLSVATSFSASFLMLRRSRFYAVSYGLNDIVIIVLWCLACRESIMYLPMVICFTAFFVLDFYGFINWTKMRKNQKKENAEQTKELTEDKNKI